MKQFQFSFRENKTLEAELRKLRRWVKSTLCSHVTVRIFTEIVDRERIERVCETVGRLLPEALYVGCSSNGNIQNGNFLGDSFLLTGTFFEKESTRVNILQYRLTEETQEEVSRALVQAVDENPWVKGVEFLLTIRGMSLTGLCDGLSKVRKDVQIFGGGAFSGDINANEACVFSKEGGYQEKGIVFVLMGGEDLHITSSYVCGWKPLGSFLRITSAERSILKELNGQPAYNTFSPDQRLAIRHTRHYTSLLALKRRSRISPASPTKALFDTAFTLNFLSGQSLQTIPVFKNH